MKGVRPNISALFNGQQPLPNPPPGAVNNLQSQSQFNPYAAGPKRYGAGRLGPNVGPTGDPLGYAERDNKAEAKKSAIQRRLTAQAGGNPNAPAYTNYINGVM